MTAPRPARRPVRPSRTTEPRRPPSSGETSSSLRESERVLRDLGVTKFTTEYGRLRRQMDSDDFSSQQASQALIRAMLGMYVHALPKIEADLQRSGGKAVYSAKAAVEIIRDLIHDMRSFGDQSALIERLRREVLQVSMASLASDIVARLSTARDEIHRELGARNAAGPERRLRALQRELQDAFGDADRRAHELLRRALEG